MVSSQKQSASDSSTAIQSTGNVTINNGMSSEQMAVILSSLAAHVDTLVTGTRDEIDRRLKDFEASVLQRFSADTTTRPDAFSEPDFLAATLDAQKAYARSGDKGLKEILTDLVAQRSKISDRCRLSLTLNDAIAKVGSIPEQDLNAMSLIFLFKDVQNTGVTRIEQLAELLSKCAQPLLTDISISQSSIRYLAAHGCVVPPSGIAEWDTAYEWLWKRYGSAISKGVSEEKLREEFPNFDELMRIGLIVDSPYREGLKLFRIFGPNLEAQLPMHGIYGDYSSRYECLVKTTKPSEKEFIFAIKPMFPEIEELFEKYNKAEIRNTTLTSIGIALAHANFKDGILSKADLSIWITP